MLARCLVISMGPRRHSLLDELLDQFLGTARARLPAMSERCQWPLILTHLGVRTFSWTDLYCESQVLPILHGTQGTQ